MDDLETVRVPLFFEQNKLLVTSCYGNDTQYSRFTSTQFT
jgi:hypothetical protein